MKRSKFSVCYAKIDLGNGIVFYCAKRFLHDGCHSTKKPFQWWD